MNNEKTSMGDNYNYNPDNDEIYQVVSVGPAANPTPLTYYKDKQGRIYYWNNGKKMYTSTNPYSGSGSTNKNNSGNKTTTTSPTTSSSNATQMAYMQQQQALLEQQRQMLEEQKRRQEELAAQKQQIAQDAYDKNKAAYETAFGERKATLDQNLASTMEGLLSDYNASKGNINTDSANSLREAYINYMNTQKSLPQALSAQGITGGATETTLAGLGNSYGNARNAIDVATVDNLSELERLYNNNRNSATQNYNSQIASDSLAKANYMAQLESDLANSVAQAYTDRINALANIDNNYFDFMTQLALSQMAYTPNGTSADNEPEPVTVEPEDESAGTEGAEQERKRPTHSNFTDYARIMKKGGASSQSIAKYLDKAGANHEVIMDIFDQLGIPKPAGL